MKTFLAIFTFLFFFQTNPYSKWDKKDLEKANTGKDISYLTDEERRVITLINLARINPTLFATTILENYIDSMSYKGSSYVNTLKKDLTYLPENPQPTGCSPSKRSSALALARERLPCRSITTTTRD